MSYSLSPLPGQPNFGVIVTGFKPEMIDDPRFRTNPDRVAHWQALQREIETALAARNSADWLGPLEEEGVPCAPLNDVADVMVNPQVAARNMIVTALDPDQRCFRGLRGDDPISAISFRAANSRCWRSDAR